MAPQPPVQAKLPAKNSISAPSKAAPKKPLADDDLERWGNDPVVQGRLRINRNEFSEYGYDWRIMQFSITPANGAKSLQKNSAQAPYWVVLHDNEDGAFDSMIAAMALYGGTALVVETPMIAPVSGLPYRRRYMPPGLGSPRGLRCQRTSPIEKLCDPNRNFGPETPGYSTQILAQRKLGQPIIALHTNVPGISGDGRGGAGNISLIDSAGALRSGAFRGVGAANLGLSDDDFVLIPSNGGAPKTADPECGARLINAGVNIWYEAIAPEYYDGSLSHYVTRLKLGTYFNIEAREDDDPKAASARQLLMLKALMTHCINRGPQLPYGVV